MDCSVLPGNDSWSARGLCDRWHGTNVKRARWLRRKKNAASGGELPEAAGAAARPRVRDGVGARISLHWNSD